MANAFTLEEREGGIALLTFDLPDSKVNTFSRATRAELAQIVEDLEGRNDLRGLLLRSGKPGQFIAGADLKELGALVESTKDEVRAELEDGHALFTRISRLPFPTVALIDGNCMGGGTELVLAMDERICSDSRKTKIALPEVKVGLIPGWGGTQRMTRLIGIGPALEMMTTGEGAGAEKACATGLVFDAVPVERLVEEGVRLVEDLQTTGEWKTNRERRSGPLGLSDDQLAFSMAVAEGAVYAKTKGQYPAPLAVVACLRESVNLPLEEGLQVEIRHAIEVTGSTISANLIGVFFMQTALGRDRGVDDPNVTPRDVHRVGVLGAGLMGSGIATAHARSGVFTDMVDVDEERIGKGLEAAKKVVQGRIDVGRAKPQDMADMFAALSTSTSQEAFRECDVVVEAVPENEDLKTSVYRQLAGVLQDDAILASNTSTISITRMAEAAPNPERFAGLHFFYPVDRMALVEVIRGEKTSDETVVTLVDLARRIRKTPIVVGDCPGFLVNRVLLPYMNEALLLLVEGAEMDRIDKVATKFGMPMGPIALHDLVGLDTAHSAGKVMAAGFADRAIESPLLADLVQAGRLGKKSGKGFRQFVGKKGKPAPDPDFDPFLQQHQTDTREVSDEEITDRLFLSMLVESTRILEEHVVRDPAHVDMGLILGIGFPAFRGGILHWADDEGPANVLSRLERYQPLGKRFEATETLRELEKSGGRFFPRG